MDRYEVWTYCTTPASPLHEKIATESEGRSLAMTPLIEFVKDSLVTTVSKFQDPYVCWEYLKKKYAPKSGSRRLLLLRKLVSSRKEETTTIEQYLKSCKETTNQLEAMEVGIPKDLIVLFIFNSLPREYQFFSRSQTRKKSLPSFDELESKLLDEELQIKMDAETEGADEALYLCR
jgi:hypothetical protein